MPASLCSQTYFATVLPQILRAKGPAASRLGVNVRFVVTGRGGGSWTIRLRPPVARVVPGAEWKADLLITLTATEMERMLAGTFDARQALQAGNIEIRGDLSLLRQVGFLLQPPPGPARPAPPQPGHGLGAAATSAGGRAGGERGL